MGGDLMTCSTCNNLYVKRCKISQRCGIWSRHHNIWSAALAGVKTMIITKNGSDETTLAYDILYINRTSFLSRFRIWNQNSNIPSVASDMACFVCISSANDQFSHSRCSNHYNCFQLWSGGSTICTDYGSKKFTSNLQLLALI